MLTMSYESMAISLLISARKMTELVSRELSHDGKVPKHTFRGGSSGRLISVECVMKETRDR